ncbi:hypothetical protein D3C77_736220 [compost metagenome]
MPLGEVVQILSIGDPGAWAFSNPWNGGQHGNATNRIAFAKAQEFAPTTTVRVVTDKHSYQLTLLGEQGSLGRRIF